MGNVDSFCWHKNNYSIEKSIIFNLQIIFEYTQEENYTQNLEFNEYYKLGQK